ncbi:MAG: redoxin domain-containing protein [Candidatus Omnitrophica bacterium]|nr:redoxin domain-containing protein [Candidatus Omnitrophota bacterium]
MDIKRNFYLPICVFIAVFLLSSCCIRPVCKITPKKVGGDPNNLMVYKNFSEVKIPIDSLQEADYLGVNAVEKDIITLSQVKADVIILEVFNFYCPLCQKEAPNVNTLYELIQQSDLSGKIKIIGVGMSNSEYEVGLFKEKYVIPFPLLADPNNGFYRIIGRVESPYFAVLKNDGNGNFERIHGVERNLPEPKDFLATVLTVSGLK